MSRRPRTERPRQLPLELALEPRFGREDFLVGPSNADAYELIDLWPAWPEPALLLVGPEGSGKSHLGAIWAAQAGASVLAARTLTGADPQALVSHGAVLIEDLDRGPLPEVELFHLINLAREGGASLLATARSRPDHWNVRTPDLLSRLRRAPVVEIAGPDDALLRALVVKLFLDRQIVVDLAVVEFILPRMERSFAGAAATVEALDREALAQGRRLTRPLAAQALERLGPT